MDIVVKSETPELLPDLGTHLATKLSHDPATVRQLYARVPGAASEPVTTAILVAVAGQAGGVLARHLFEAITAWVKRHGRAVSIEVPADATSSSHAGVVTVTLQDVSDPKVLERAMALLGAAND